MKLSNVTSKKRDAGLDLLRCLAMMMVIILHYLGKGNILPPLQSGNMDGVGIFAWLLEAFAIVAVNVYMLISGYYLSTQEFKFKRLINLWLQVWFYSALFGLIGSMTGVIKETQVDTHFYLTLLFPISMNHYWFMTAYIFLYILLPFIGPAVKNMTREQLRNSILILFTVFCILKSVLPVRLETDAKGYDYLWYLCVFLFAAYIRKFGLKYLDNIKAGLLLYVGGALCVFGEAFLLRAVYLRTGSLDRILDITYEYNHLFVFIASLGLFLVFKNVKLNNKFGQFASFLAPYTLGVYLMHENLGLRYTWQNWFMADRINSIPGLIAWVIVAALIIFTVGILVDMVRKKVFDILTGILAKK